MLDARAFSITRTDCELIACIHPHAYNHTFTISTLNYEGVRMLKFAVVAWYGGFLRDIHAFAWWKIREASGVIFRVSEQPRGGHRNADAEDASWSVVSGQWSVVSGRWARGVC